MTNLQPQHRGESPEEPPPAHGRLSIDSLIPPPTAEIRNVCGTSPAVQRLAPWIRRHTATLPQSLEGSIRPLAPVEIHRELGGMTEAERTALRGGDSGKIFLTGERKYRYETFYGILEGLGELHRELDHQTFDALTGACLSDRGHFSTATCSQESSTGGTGTSKAESEGAASGRAASGKDYFLSLFLQLVHLGQCAENLSKSGGSPERTSPEALDGGDSRNLDEYLRAHVGGVFEEVCYLHSIGVIHTANPIDLLQGCALHLLRDSSDPILARTVQHCEHAESLRTLYREYLERARTELPVEYLPPDGDRLAVQHSRRLSFHQAVSALVHTLGLSAREQIEYWSDPYDVLLRHAAVSEVVVLSERESNPIGPLRYHSRWEVSRERIFVQLAQHGYRDWVICSSDFDSKEIVDWLRDTVGRECTAREILDLVSEYITGKYRGIRSLSALLQLPSVLPPEIDQWVSLFERVRTTASRCGATIHVIPAHVDIHAPSPVEALVSAGAKVLLWQKLACVGSNRDLASECTRIHRVKIILAQSATYDAAELDGGMALLFIFPHILHLTGDHLGWNQQGIGSVSAGAIEEALKHSDFFTQTFSAAALTAGLVARDWRSTDQLLVIRSGSDDFSIDLSDAPVADGSRRPVTV